MKIKSLAGSDTGLFILFFLYTAGVAFAIQLVLLPYVFPKWHAGNGLLIGGDWIHFHELAVNMADKIHHFGWSSWNINPEGQTPAGIAAAIYALTVSKPWVLIPLNAFLHASSALIIVKMMRRFLPVGNYAVYCALPFLFYPSAATWYAQIHRDGMSILGALLVLYGWIIFSEWRGYGTQRSWRTIIRIFAYIACGIFLMGISRPYMLIMIKVISLLILMVFTGIVFFSTSRKEYSLKNNLFSLIISWMIMPFIIFTSQLVTPEKFAAASTLNSLTITGSITDTITDTITGSSYLPEDFPDPGGLDHNWEKAFWLPDNIDNKFKTLSLARDGFRLSKPDAPSNIDVKVKFSSASEILEYLPRAAQIALLAPFPNQWLKQGSLASNTIMRKISALEMVGVYFSLVFLPYAIRKWCNRPSFWIIILFCLFFLLLYSIVIMNVGTLYRSRYVFVMLMSALGLAGFFELYSSNANKTVASEKT